MNSLMNSLDNIYQAQYLASSLETITPPFEKDKIRKDFDVIGIRNSDGSIEKYFDVLEGKAVPISLKQLLSAYTPFIDLLKSLSSQRFVFLMKSSVVGYIVTVADLEKSLMKAYLFTFFVVFENTITKCIQKIEKNEMTECLKKMGEDREKQILKTFEKKKKRNEEISIQECLLFSDKINLYLCSCKDKELAKIKDKLIPLRNGIAHGDQIFLSFKVKEVYSILIFILEWEKRHRTV